MDGVRLVYGVNCGGEAVLELDRELFGCVTAGRMGRGGEIAFADDEGLLAFGGVGTSRASTSDVVVVKAAPV